MALSPGTRLGPYEMLSVLGAGGMGEVYRARDTRLNRVVAVKVLLQHLSSNPQLRERFDREAKAISSLSHPHICPLYDVGQQDGIDYLVMEHLEGETLAVRLKKGPLPTDQVLHYAIQIADALDTAHRHGVVHRDLKPGNVMLTKTGAKLLDFGLAKVRVAEAAAGVTAAPTQTTPLTGEGTILGTLQYMAPEQLEGAEADARTDIFALGAVIYEMATGRKAFEGKSQASLISNIMTTEPPPISTVQSMTPPALDHVVRTCLAKDPDARWQTAHDVLVEMKWIAEAGSQAGASGTPVTRNKNRELISWALVAVLLVALSVVLLHQRPGEAHAVRFQVPVPDKVSEDLDDFPVISPDGQRLVLPGVASDGIRHLWLRSLDSLTDQLLPGTEDADSPFWSPDSRFVAFFSTSKLKKIDVSGGPVQTICDVPVGAPDVARAGGAWNQDGVILLGSNGMPLRRVSADGGEPQPVLELDKSRRESGHAWPSFLPDGRHFLYLALSADTGQDATFVGSLDSRQTQLVIRGASNASYVTSGFLIYARQQTVLAQKFDAKTLRVTGSPIPIAEQVGDMTFRPGTLFSVSQSGVLVYRGGGSGRVQLAWYNRAGQRLAPIGKPGVYPQIALSPDEKQLAVERVDPESGTHNLWILELASGIFSRLTFNPASDYNPVWSLDGRELVFSSVREGHQDLYRKPIRGGDEELLYHSVENKGPYHWSKDGWILFWDGGNFYRLPLVGERKPIVALKSEFNKDLAAVSRDGRWVAYESQESGRSEVYVASYPTFAGKRQVSNAGGSQPMWRTDGKELFYLTLDGKLAVVDLKVAATLEAGVPHVLFQAPVRVNQSQTEYCVTVDGKRFIFREPEGASTTPTTVVLNWNAGLTR
jgi:eukaryotic-like serine/threonine-protein kinase